MLTNHPSDPAHDRARRERYLSPDLRHLIPAGPLYGGRDELVANVAFAEWLLIDGHRPLAAIAPDLGIRDYPTRPIPRELLGGAYRKSMASRNWAIDDG